MAINFNTEPFFDDYSDDDKFHRILFRPGYAVQARELSQLQTILQEQVRRHGDHIFKEGSMVIPGQVSYDLDMSYIKLVTDTTVDVTSLLKQLVGKEIQNVDGLIAKVITYSLAETVDSVFQPNTLFVKYQNSVQDVNGNNVTEFAPDEVLSPVDGTTGLDFTVTDTVYDGYPPVGKGSIATIQRGIYYIKKNFVLVTDQTIILDKYDVTPSYRVGLKLSEEVIYPEDDEQLLDNALGSPNYAAPGACRYKMDLILTAIEEDPAVVTQAEEEDFIDLMRLKNGEVLYKIDRSNYAELEKTLARRTYDESGDYTLNPFNIQIRNYRNNLRGGWSASEVYIQGDLIAIGDEFTGYNYFVATSNGLSGSNQPDFSIYASVDNINDNEIVWEYVDYPSFNNGVNAFTAGDSNFNAFTVDDHIRLDGMMLYCVEAGKAYVRGYEIEKISTEYLAAEKARYLPAGSAALAAYFGVDTLPEVLDAESFEKTTSFDLSMGPYCNVNTVSYLPDIVSLPEYALYDDTYANGGNEIGRCRVRAIENNSVAGEYKIFPFDIQMFAGYKFSQALHLEALTNPATKFHANFIQDTGETILYGGTSNGLIFQLPDYAVSSISEVSYSVVVSLTATSSDGTLDLACPTGYSYESVNDSDNYIICDNSTGTDVTSSVTALEVQGSNLHIEGLTLQQHTVFATIRRSDAINAETQRSVQNAAPIELISEAGATAKSISLQRSYVTTIISVTMSDNAWDTVSPVYAHDITNRYMFDSGQNVNKIGFATLELQAGADEPTGPIQIKYEYLDSSESTPGDFIGVGSYTHANSYMRYDQIPAVDGFLLADCVDFRPYAIGAGYDERYFPKYGTTGSFKYTHNLARIDNIALGQTGNFIVSRGIPSLSPSEPRTPANSMKIARISVEPYTFTTNNVLGTIINRQENKRYTMRDIGKLERRIQDLEYYTSLTLTELETKNMTVLDGNGLQRYNNGFIIDNFSGQGVGNAASDDWNASIDSNEKELRPFFSQKQVDLVENIDSSYAQSGDYTVSGDLITLPFTEKLMISQTKASQTENVNPYALYSWKGVSELNPWSDTWFSTRYRPDIVLNDESQYNALVAKAEEDGVLGTVWNSWQTVFSSTSSLGTRLENLGRWSRANNEILNSSNNGGSFWRNRATFTIEEREFIGGAGTNTRTGVPGSRVLTIETQAVETTSERTGTRSFIVDRIDSRVVEDRVVDTRIVPYIRPRKVLFTGYGYKPNTRMYAYFDGLDVTKFCRSWTRLRVTPVAKPDNSLYPVKFDIYRNAGSAVSTNQARNELTKAVPLSGTVTLTNGSTTISSIEGNGDSGTSFLSQLEIGDIIDVQTTLVDRYARDQYRVTAVTDNNTITIDRAYTGSTESNISLDRITRSARDQIQICFNHGEVIKEVNGNGNTGIVVAQEIYNGRYYIYIVNERGTKNWSTNASAYLEGEYEVDGLKPRVKYDDSRWAPSQGYLRTTLTGQLCGIFDIPCGPGAKFRTGTRELRFSNINNASKAIRDAQESTSGGVIYEANGLIEVKQRTIVATRTANLVSEQVSNTNTIVTTSDRLTRDTGWYDPLAETFMVQEEGGCFITSVDVYFATADAKIPVRVEIREVVNGYPGAAVLPFGQVEMKAEDVITDSLEGKTPTNFKFVSPVYLQNGVEYALVVLSDSNNYNIWVAETDQIDVVSLSRISSQPYNGVLFKSQNGSAWTADQTQDMKFRIHRAEFNQTPVTVEFIPPQLNDKQLAFNPFNFITGSAKCRVEHPNHGMISGEKVMFKTRQIIDSINGIPASEIFDVEHTISNAELDSYVVEFTTVSNAEGAVGGSYITATENYEFSTAMAEIAEIVPEGTTIDYELKVVDHADQLANYDIILKENTTFEDVKVYPNPINYTSVQFPSGLSVLATLTPSSTLRSISPVIDVGRMALTMVQNKIDKPNLSINDIDLDHFLINAAEEIGSGKNIELVDLDGDTVLDTIVIDQGVAPTLFVNMNNNINTGDVLRFTYTGITNAIRNMVIVAKSQDSTGKLYFTVEGYSGEILQDTTVSNTVKIEWLSHFKSEYAASGGSTTSKYVSKKINFSRPSEMIRIMFDAIIPAEADVDIYYKTGLGVDSDYIESRYIKATPSSYTKNPTDFREIIADVEGLDQFDAVMVKLVMKSSNRSKIPRIKNLRIIACAA